MFEGWFKVLHTAVSKLQLIHYHWHYFMIRFNIKYILKKSFTFKNISAPDLPKTLFCEVNK